MFIIKRKNSNPKGTHERTKNQSTNNKNQKTMKKKFNILCMSMVAVIILYVAGSIAYTGVITYKIASKMTSMSKEEMMEMKKNIEVFDNEKYSMCALTLIPNDFITGINETTIENTVTGEQTPIMPVKSVAFVKNTGSNSSLTDIITDVTGVICAAAYIFFICYLVRFIRNVRRNEIFEWKNVKMLRRMGISITVAFVMTVAANLAQYAAATSIFAPKGYMVDWFSGVSENILLLGIGIAAMIMGEVFARGLQMREEQELTI